MTQKAEIAQLTNKILTVTMEIKDHYPEVYLLLNESPILFPSDNKELNSNDFKEYLNTIESQLKKMTTF